jgi:hypothetical protein
MVETSIGHLIHVDGIHLGTVVRHQLGVEFVAVNGSVKDMHRSIWPSPEYAERAARQLFNSARTGRFF